MKIHIPLIFVKQNHNSSRYLLNLRILFWHFQIIDDTDKIGYFVNFCFNKHQLKNWGMKNWQPIKLI